MTFKKTAKKNFKKGFGSNAPAFRSEKMPTIRQLVDK